MNKRFTAFFHFLSLLLLLIVSISCNSPDFDLSLLNYDESVKIEMAYNIKTEGVNPNDNLIFSKCNSFTFKYFIEKAGKKYLAKIKENEPNDFRKNYELIEYDKVKNELCIDRFLLFTPFQRPPNASIAPTQSLIKSYWITNENTVFIDSNEGIIENYENLWMHPFRFLHMWPTFTAPWPYVDYPIEIGKKYNWWKKLDGAWGTDKYIQWDSIVHFDYSYEVRSTEIVEIKNKKIDCFVIQAKGTSPIGNTEVTFYFNPTLGFTKMDYHLMDQSRIVLYLDVFELDCDFSPLIPESNTQ